MTTKQLRNLIIDDFNYQKISFITARDRLIATGLTDYAAEDRLWTVENLQLDAESMRPTRFFGGAAW